MEGKEVRFGIFNSALFATITTDASCGAVNCMHDSLTPIGGLVPMFNIQTWRSGLRRRWRGMYGMLIFIVIAIFIAGLMVGRTPEYLGKKIEAFDVKVAALAILVLTVIILGFSAWACVPASGELGGQGAEQQRPARLQRDSLRLHLRCRQQRLGFRRADYQHVGCRGWHHAGHYDVTLAIDMLVGRFFMIIPLLALGWASGEEETGAAKRRKFSGWRGDVHRAACGNRDHCRSAHVPAGAGAGTDR